jgi:hypothetical protein
MKENKHQGKRLLKVMAEKINGQIEELKRELIVLGITIQAKNSTEAFNQILQMGHGDLELVSSTPQKKGY